MGRGYCIKYFNIEYFNIYHKQKKTQILKAFVKIILGKFSYNLFSGKLYLHMQVQIMRKNYLGICYTTSTGPQHSHRGYMAIQRSKFKSLHFAE